MDASITRRGQPCWYRAEGVGRAKAMNDVLVVEGAIFQMIRKYFHKESFYVDLMHIVLDVR
jgi:farnesyl diphosphate synthase